MPPAELAAATVKTAKQSGKSASSRASATAAGAIFKPEEGNVLADILLARSVTGESPSKAPRGRKSVAAATRTPGKPRASLAASKAKSKTPRPRKSTAASRVADSTTTPAKPKRRRSTLKKAKAGDKDGNEDENGNEGTPVCLHVLAHTRLIVTTCHTVLLPSDDIADMRTDAETRDSAAPARPSRARRPFAEQLADAINAAKDPATPSAKALGKRKAPAAPPARYTEELEPDADTEPHIPTQMSPVARAVEKQRLERLRIQADGDGGESDVPLAAKLVGTDQTPATKRTRAAEVDEEEDPPPPKKRATKAKAKTKESAPAKKRTTKKSAGKGGAADTGTSSKTTAVPDPPKAKPTRKGASKAKAKAKADDNGDGEAPAPEPRKAKRKAAAAPAPESPPKRVRIDAPQEDEPSTPPREQKGKERSTKIVIATVDEDEPAPPAKKRRQADPNRGKENALSKSAREAPVAASDGPLPSPVKPMRKRASKTRTAAGTKSAPKARASAKLPSRGPPPAVLRRIKLNARALPALGEIDDDDPIDFLR
ncbi:hypothetical protein BC834DRAFT_967287 [Gloeopeniophorella convolvens]|nr:hypothetical protein BC834DRAFT_967287 [Gloeopeniophorella convolvens]